MNLRSYERALCVVLLWCVSACASNSSNGGGEEQDDASIADTGAFVEADTAPSQDTEVESPDTEETVDTAPPDSAECIVDNDCNDENPCTDDTCEAGSCVNSANAQPCDDGLFCNGPDTCQDGACELHEGDPCVGSLCDEESRRCVGCIDKDDCDDNNPCTDDVCELGFCSNNVTEGSCDDGLFCNGPDICQGGVCEPLGNTDPCDGGLCDEFNDACSPCIGNGQCDDGDPCTDDICDNGACTYAFNREPCDDGLFCNGPNTCIAGSCVASQQDPCNGIFCVEENDTCDDSRCARDEDCDDDNMCTDDVCADGFCDILFNNNPCSDGIYCNGTDACENGMCTFHAGNPCEVDDVCDEDRRVCIVDGNVVIQAETDGNATSSARMRLTCEANGDTCVVEGNRPRGETFCAVSCPVGSTVDVCCSNGSEPCGGSFDLPNGSRSIDGFSVSGAESDCNNVSNAEVVMCTVQVGTLPVNIECDFTD